ncbi:hypothetical protein [Verrucomicrobium sp. BvORR034]|uniref:hypothetical protein n=1 Tax=Verrucomicrobium sp. BvORR034 TaxID=1396418 RepID=UPI0006798901|nr:hypothetical protein [Verrucomicrobium sp. BvORR034]
MNFAIRKLQSLLRLLLCLLLTGQAYAIDPADQGIVVIKTRPGQGDEFAQGVIYTRCEHFAVTSTIHHGRGQSTIIQRTNLVTALPFDDVFSRILVDDSGTALVSEKLQQLRALLQRYPGTAATLRPLVDELTSYQQKFAAGEVRFRGTWMARTAFDKIVRDEEQKLKDAELARQKARDEKTAMELKARQDAEAEALRQAALKQKAEDETRQKKEMATRAESARRQAETDDEARRAGNLRVIMPGLAARLLQGTHATFATFAQGRGTPTAPPVQPVPAAWQEGALPTPRISSQATAIKPGTTHLAPAIQYWESAEGLVAARLCVPLQQEGARATNTDDLRHFQRLVAMLSPTAAEWLPLSLASARARLRLDGNTQPDARPTAVLTREFDRRTYQLTYEAPAIHEDGYFYSYLTLSVR